MNIICPNISPCPVVNPPYTNLSSEMYDREIFFGWNSDSIPEPPIGSNWSSWSCLGTCVSYISQEDADLCAYNANLQCRYDQANDNPNDPPPDNPGTGDPYTIYYSNARSGTSTCPDGTTISYTAPPGLVQALSQVMADRMAQALAKRTAERRKVCLSELSGPCTTDDGIVLYITASGSNIDMGNLLGAGYNYWYLVSGTLPPGMRLLVQRFFDITSTGFPGGYRITLEGNPTTPGNYSFVVKFLAPSGVYTEKTYYVGILNDSTVGSVFSETLVKPSCAGAHDGISISGSLNDGLNWTQDISGNDIISGTPTEVGTCAFNIRYI